MKPLPETIEVEMFVYRADGDRITASTASNLEDFGFVMLGAETVPVPVPRVNPVQKELETLDRKTVALRARFEDELGKINGRRKELIALTWQPEGAA